MPSNRLVVVSNRLPVIVEQQGQSQRLRASTGGLVTALTPVMEREQGLWIGWLGYVGAKIDPALLKDFARDHAYKLKPVSLTNEDVEGFYHGFSNRAVWPLFHDLIGYCRFELEQWKSYDDVNRRFAKSVCEGLRPGDTIWIHDYQLMMVASHLRRMGVSNPIMFFLHIPFPSVDVFRRMPWRNELIRGLMEFDLLGFQTRRDHKNFVGCVKAMVPDVKISRGRGDTQIEYGNRTVRAGDFPISIDFDEFADAAASHEVAAEAKLFHTQFSAKKLALGIDRLDYTKGIPHRFLAFERALEKYPELRGNLSLFQVVVPSRTHVQDYQDLKGELDRLVGRINGWFAQTSFRTRRWIPIHYMYGRLDRTQLLACYRACDIALITPLRDGMNLVAKEYCASQIDGKGVLILSEFAGTADQLGKGSIIINPYDREKSADAIHEAYKMSLAERRKRMKLLRSEVRRKDVHQWVKWFFEAAGYSQQADSDRKSSLASLKAK